MITCAGLGRGAFGEDNKIEGAISIIQQNTSKYIRIHQTTAKSKKIPLRSSAGPTPPLGAATINTKIVRATMRFGHP